MRKKFIKYFPSRKNNIYAKTIKKLIPFKEYDFSNVSIGTIQHNIKIPKDKYYGINFTNMNGTDESRRLEYRYIGGKDYEKRTGDILDLMSTFCMDVLGNTGTPFENEDIEELSKFLDEKITNFKNFIKYDSFLVEFPNIHLQIDQQDHYDIISSYYPKIYKKVYELIESTEGLEDCIINYFTTQHRFEVIGAKFKSVLNLNNYDFINCDITDGIFDKCNLINSDLRNGELNRSKVSGSNIDGCKLMNCNVETTKLDGCLFINGYMNANMISGIFRSGKVGPYGTLSSTTKIVNDKTNFFGIKDDEDGDGKDKKGGFKK